MAVLLTGCTKKADWHQKMVLYFDTPNGPMTASSVIRVDFTGAIEWLGSMDGNHTDLTGEAVVADLGGRYLFALLEEKAGPLIWLTMRRQGEDIPGFKDAIRKVERQTAPLDVPEDLWPRLVSFKDVDDPLSVQFVNANDIAAEFGNGYSLHRVTVRVTSEPVTNGRVEAVLSWLESIVPNRLDGSRLRNIEASNQVANSVSPFDFSTELSNVSLKQR